MLLRERLRVALQAAGAVPAARPAVRAPARTECALPLQRADTGLGDICFTEELRPLDYRHGHLRLGDATLIERRALERLAPGLAPGELRRAAFLDIETTGLAGGTGTYAFLVGIAMFDDRALRLRQFFLAGLGGETAMLTAVADALEGSAAVVTFNGRRFDVPLLETRFVMSRLRPPFGRLPHVDLLYPARRLYGRRLASCRLGALEEALLGVWRDGDVPGWAVPGIYFDYLRRGVTRPLAGVFRHNRLDVLSLVTLLAHIGGVAADDEPARPDDCLALARWDEALGREREAARLYARVLESGAGGHGAAFALRRLTRLYRRGGRWDDLEALLTASIEGDVPAGRRLDALVELAKLKEHRRRDFAAAESLTRQAVSLHEVLSLRGAPREAAHTRDALERRLLRLRRRARAVRMH